MAKTAIPVTTVSPFAGGAALTSGTAGDANNDHSIAGGTVPRLHLIVSNAHSSSIDFTVDVASQSATYNESVLKTHTVPAIAGSIEGKYAVVLDSGTMVNADGTVYVSGSDANFNLLTFYAYTWTPTQAP